ncbi:MAG: DNA repair protein RecN [Omnitrophica bacterium GWA2_52_8]|nr:MAG: DNA repair protein RecN [Omnitrophica bacterium GWA2_52_8]
MLTQLRICNFALIEDLTLQFSPRLNVLTGETGAGKSILIDGLRFLMGERLNNPRFVSPKEPVSAEAAFEPDDVFLKSHVLADPFMDGEEKVLILRREVLEGKSRCWINGHLVTLATLREIGGDLIDIHGQYDHQLLFNPGTHLTVTDQFSKIETLKNKYAAVYEKYKGLLAEQERMRSIEAGRERELDLLKYQIDEIERAGIEDLDEEELAQEHSRLANSEKLFEKISALIEMLEEGDPSAGALIGDASRDMQEIARIDASLEALKEDFEVLQVKLDEVVQSLRGYQELLTFDPARLKEVEGKLDVIELLKKKYGQNLLEVQEFYYTAKEKYDRLLNRDLYQKENNDQIAALQPELTALADKMTGKRRQACDFLKENIEAELKDLGINRARFDAAFEKTDFGAEGRDRLEFMITLNPGQPPMPLSKIISGGEASRVMLALKKALTKVDPVPTLIFDEIDANIGGRLGQVTGKKLKELSQQRQVLLVTHLPQIASFADLHIKVTKTSNAGKTRVQYQVIRGEERVRELAQMMSGHEETEIAKKHARELLRQQKKE